MWRLCAFVVVFSDSRFHSALTLIQWVRRRSSFLALLPPPNQMKNAASLSTVHQPVYSITLAKRTETEIKGFGVFEACK